MDLMFQYLCFRFIIYDFFIISFGDIKRTINQILRCLQYNLYHHSFHLAHHLYFLHIFLRTFYFIIN